MIKILIGESGCGKSTYILNAISENARSKKRAYLIAPEQKTLIEERKIASELPESAQLYVEALNFTRLANKLFRTYGGIRYNYINEGGKSLIMYRAVSSVRGLLKEYEIKKGKEKGTVALFSSAIAELKAYGKEAIELREKLSLIENDRLRLRLEDLCTVYDAYDSVIANKFDDPYDNMLSLARILENEKFFEGADVYIDSFNGFTGAQLRVIRSIIEQADNVTIAFDIPKRALDGEMQYKKISGAYRSILKICSEVNKRVDRVFFENDYFHKNESIKYLSQNIWSFDAKPSMECEGISLVSPSDEFDECEYVASQIKELVMNGEKYGDIAVIMRSPEIYRGIIDNIFDKYEIEYYFSLRSDISTKPLIKLILSAIRAVNGYYAQDVISFIKSGYVDITDDEADELEEYIYRWNIYGKKFLNDDFWSSNPDGYVSEPTIMQMDKLARINETRARVISALEIIDNAFLKVKSADEICVDIYKFLEKHSIRDKLKGEIALATTKDEASEISQIYKVFLKALDTVATVMKGEYLDAEAFENALRYSLEGVNIGSIPTGEDKVTIGEASGLRTDSIKHVFVLGVTEGSFPKTLSETSFFTDADKEALEGLGIMLSESDDVKADSELLNLKNSIACASHTACISYPKCDIVGNKKEPSIAIRRIKALFPGVKEIDTSKLSLVDRVYNESVAREYASYSSSPSSDAIREALGIEGSISCDLANDSLKIDEKEANEIFGKTIYLSQTKIESFVKCKLQYYCRHLLKLKSSARITFEAKDVGYLAHEVFEKFLKRVKEGKLDFASITDFDIQKMVDEIITEYTEKISSSSAQTRRIKHLFRVLRSNLLIFVRSIVDEFTESDFTPEYFELSFSGGENGPAPLKFKVGENARIILSGVADRVDVYRKDDKTYVRVVDYKTGSKKITESDIQKGINVQMLIYLFTLCNMEDCEFKAKLLGNTSSVEPAGILYFPMRIGKASSDEEVDLLSSDIDEIEKKIVIENISRNGMLLDDIEILSAQEKGLEGKFIPKYSKRASSTFVTAEKFDEHYKTLQRVIDEIGTAMLSGEADAVPMKMGKGLPCDYCEHIAVCRRRLK